MAKTAKETVARDLGLAAVAFGAGWTVQELENFWWAYANGAHAYLGETLNDFIAYWSPLVSPWNFFGLLAGVGLSLVPDKEGSNGRKVAKAAGLAILGAEGWGYAGHNQTIGGQLGLKVFSAGGIALSPLSGAPAGQIPPNATVPGSSFYTQPRIPGTQVGATPGPKNFF